MISNTHAAYTLARPRRGGGTIAKTEVTAEPIREQRARRLLKREKTAKATAIKKKANMILEV
jgi:hypothetical protein